AAELQAHRAVAPDGADARQDLRRGGPAPVRGNAVPAVPALADQREVARGAALVADARLRLAREQLRLVHAPPGMEAGVDEHAVALAVEERKTAQELQEVVAVGRVQDVVQRV